jgi:hypothetical protein
MRRRSHGSICSHHADLAALAAFASADEDRAAVSVEVTLR